MRFVSRIHSLPPLPHLPHTSSPSHIARPEPVATHSAVTLCLITINGPPAVSPGVLEACLSATSRTLSASLSTGCQALSSCLYCRRLPPKARKGDGQGGA